MNSQSGVLGHNSLECKRVPRGSWLGASRWVVAGRAPREAKHALPGEDGPPRMAGPEAVRGKSFAAGCLQARAYRMRPPPCQGAWAPPRAAWGAPEGRVCHARSRVALLGNIPDIPCEARLALDAGRPS